MLLFTPEISEILILEDQEKQVTEFRIFQQLWGNFLIVRSHMFAD